MKISKIINSIFFLVFILIIVQVSLFVYFGFFAVDQIQQGNGLKDLIDIIWNGSQQ